MTRSTDDPAIKKSVSMPTSILKKALIRAKSLGYNLSQYIQHLMRDDLLRSRPELPRTAEPSGEYGSKKAKPRPNSKRF